MTTGSPWEAWAPKLDPPTPGGLPYDEAAAIAALWWDDDPHEAAAQMWEAWLDPTPAVSMVNTGAQSVSYGTATPTGDYGLAIARARWHRLLCSSLRSVPLRIASSRADSPRLPQSPLSRVRRGRRLVRPAPETAVLVVGADAAGLGSDEEGAARRVPVVPGVRCTCDRRSPRGVPRVGRERRPVEPPVSVRTVPPPYHRPGGRVGLAVMAR